MFKHYQFGFMHVVLNTSNGEIRYFEHEVDNERQYEIFLLGDGKFNRPIDIIKYNVLSYSKLTLSINLTTKCNFNCKYCFSDHSKGRDFKNFDSIVNLIEDFVKMHLGNQSIFIDLSGSGEPLLHLNKIIEIADKCKKLSEKYDKNIVIQFVTNGYLLSPKVVKLLQSHSILFGVSLDGCKENHDKNRVLKNGNPTYDIVIKNLSSIKEKQFLGTAMVIDGSFNQDLLQCYLNMIQYSTTISIKFKRSEKIDEFKNSYSLIISEYFKVVVYLFDMVMENDFSLLFAILNGDDSFGTMLSRVVIENKVYARCDGGVGRYSYDIDGDLYPCAPCSCDENFKIEEKNHLYQNITDLNYCGECEAKFYCGGECPIVKNTLKSNDVYLCKIKKKLFEYSLWFKSSLLKFNLDAYNKIYKFIIEKETR